MEFFAFLFIAVLLVIILTRLNSSLQYIDSLQHNIERLNEKITLLTKAIAALQAEDKPKEKATKPKEEIKPIVDETPLFITQEIKITPPEKEIWVEKPVAPVIIEQQFVSPPQPAIINEPQESWFEKWLRNNPDIEKFIGENLINKIGIAVLILGIAFFVKYAIDQDWINEVGRVCIGLLCGIILVFVSYRLKRNYRSFSSVLVGGGLTVFYFTIAFAFHQYNLLSQSAAFIIMVVITVFAVALSVLYDRIELGILATIGGFITPFLVSTGEGNYIVLFTYLSILNGGLIILAFYKRWHAIHFIAFIFTALIYGGWLITSSNKSSFPYQGTFLFGTFFYFMFVAMNILLYVKKTARFVFHDVALLIAVNLGYYSAGIFLLQQWGNTIYNGLFTASLGVINLILSFIFYKRKNIDKKFIYLLIGITLTFISLTAPIQLQGHTITIFWSAEMVLLFWLYQRSFIFLLKISVVIITTLMLISLCMDWVQVYSNSYKLLPVIVNRGFITSLFSTACMYAMAYLLKKEADTFYIAGITNNNIKIFYATASIVIFFIAGYLEINHQFSSRYPHTGLEYCYLELFTLAYAVLVLNILPALKLKISSYIKICLPLILSLYYLFNIQAIYSVEKYVLESGKYQLHYLSHLFAVIFFAILIMYSINHIKLVYKNEEKILAPLTWFTAIVITIFTGEEVKQLYIWLTYQNPSSILYSQNLYNKAGLSIVWGLLSFMFIWLGMKYHYKTIRIIALVLFGVTLIKLFVYDIQNISAGGKILAFILLGVLLLIISFMYQRLKKLLIDNAAAKD